jgi:putative phage-type endonuclease
MNEQFLERRRAGIGGSDIGAILGLSPWKTPLEVYQSKISGPEDTGSEAAYWGTVLEGAVATRYAEQTARRVQRVNALLALPGTVALANIDRAVINPAIAGRVAVRADGHTLTTDRILECKTAHALAANRSEEWGEAGTDAVPAHYLAQCQWYLGITGASVCDLAVLFGGQRHTIYTLAADAELFADMLGEAESWWHRHMDGGIPPDPANVSECRRLWKSHMPGKSQIVDVRVAADVAGLRGVRAVIAESERRADELMTRILSAFGDAEEITHQGVKLATWKQNKDSQRTDWKGLAETFSPTPEAIAAFTTTQPGARVLRLNQKED